MAGGLCCLISVLVGNYLDGSVGILGMDILSLFGCKLDLHNGTIIVGNKVLPTSSERLKPFCCRIQAASHEISPVGHEVIIPARMTTQPRKGQLGHESFKGQRLQASPSKQSGAHILQLSELVVTVEGTSTAKNFPEGIGTA